MRRKLNSLLIVFFYIINFLIKIWQTEEREKLICNRKEKEEKINSPVVLIFVFSSSSSTSFLCDCVLSRSKE